ncbi:hypothetical protein A0H81_01406 [Grifola frondosa]|uniref:PEHE domain-containing protein n=1 Tax=Grifola frondosa TaxID=5627 RepID=A0A1C7MRR9_GRIFR|nr:hypothetical protein A0H81_01406 [Grifola frondosa]
MAKPYASKAAGSLEITSASHQSTVATNSPTPLLGMSSPAPEQTSPMKQGLQTRQKRVLPSRSRRGGPGVGGCETDAMILETMRRRLESEPLIAADTKFLLTTNSSLVPSASTSSETELNTQAYGRYFDRPEVRKAFSAQKIIQTPEFTQLSDDANVGGRFRPRGSEDETTDTSDAAYEKRHRKYETFEKRQRLREKEKLKHEQYKLKERIEQLRAMDTSAFLTLPAADFPVPEAPDSAAVPAHDTPEPETGLGEPSHLHGAMAYHEGERRRKAMLDIALALEQRYRTLLPTERKFFEKKSSKQYNVGLSAEPDYIEDESSTVVEQEAGGKAGRGVPSYHDEDGESEVDLEEKERQRSKKLKLTIKLAPRLLPPTDAKTLISKKQTTLSPFMAKAAQLTSPRTETYTPGRPSIPFPSRSPGVIVRCVGGKFLPKNKRSSGEAPLATPPYKRRRADGAASKGRLSKSTNSADWGESTPAAERHSPSRASPSTKSFVSYAGAAGRPERTTCMLLVSALRNSSAPNARKTQRHVTAFGTRVPPEIEEVRDFEIPAWLHTEEENGEDVSSDVASNEEQAEPYLHLHDTSEEVDVKYPRSTYDTDIYRRQSA